MGTTLQAVVSVFEVEAAGSEDTPQATVRLLRKGRAQFLKLLSVQLDHGGRQVQEIVYLSRLLVTCRFEQWYTLYVSKCRISGVKLQD